MALDEEDDDESDEEAEQSFDELLQHAGNATLPTIDEFIEAQKEDPVVCKNS